MGRESPTGRYRHSPRKGFGFLVGVALLLAILGACAPKPMPPQSRPDPWSVAEELYLKGKKTKAREVLEELFSQGDYRCRAAFYLWVLYGEAQKYLTSLEDYQCLESLPAEIALLKRYQKVRQRLTDCQKEREKDRRLISSLKKEKVSLKEEIKRLRFELEKLEEIRRDTEQRRLKTSH